MAPSHRPAPELNASLPTELARVATPWNGVAPSEALASQNRIMPALSLVASRRVSALKATDTGQAPSEGKTTESLGSPSPRFQSRIERARSVAASRWPSG